jgi:hypothetical protein
MMKAERKRSLAASPQADYPKHGPLTPPTRASRASDWLVRELGLASPWAAVETSLTFLKLARGGVSPHWVSC